MKKVIITIIIIVSLISIGFSLNQIGRSSVNEFPTAELTLCNCQQADLSSANLKACRF